MPNEDFTTYTEVDPQGELTVIASKVSWSAIGRDVAAYVHDDKTAGHFNGDYEHLIEVELTNSANTPITSCWKLSNSIEHLNRSDDKHYLRLDTSLMRLHEWSSSSGYFSNSYAGSENVLYYLKFKRVEADGEFGTLYCYIYDDSGRTNLLATLTLTLHEKADFRYVYPFCSYSSGMPTSTQTGYSQNLDLQEVGVTTLLMRQANQLGNIGHRLTGGMQL